MYSTKKVHETYWCSSSVACQEKRTDWILRIFTFNNKNSLYLPIILTLQFLWGSKSSRSNPISHRTIRRIPKIKNSEFKSARFFQRPFYFKFWDQSPSLHFQYCLQVSETVSWHKFQCCYSANILQHWIGGGAWFISAKYTIPEFPEIFPGIKLVLIIYVKYCRLPVFKKRNLYIIMKVTILCQFKSWKYCFQT